MAEQEGTVVPFPGKEPSRRQVYENLGRLGPAFGPDLPWLCTAFSCEACRQGPANNRRMYALEYRLEILEQILADIVAERQRH